MPTSSQEATKIVEIAREYLELDKIKELFTRLHNEVGSITENSSLKVSLEMMYKLVNPPTKKPSRWLWASFYLVVIVHVILIIGVACSFLLLPFYAPWYVALPIDLFIFFFVTNPVNCKITELENYVRQKLGLKRIGGFVSHYFIKPIKRMLS